MIPIYSQLQRHIYDTKIGAHNIDVYIHYMIYTTKVKRNMYTYHLNNQLMLNTLAFHRVSNIGHVSKGSGELPEFPLA